MEYLFLVLAIAFVLANGFFVATEYAMVKIRPSRLQSLVAAGRPGATHALKMVQRMDSYLSATQFGVTLASLGLGWVGEPAFAHVVQPLILRLMPPGESAQQITHTLSLVLAFSLITVLHIVIGELAPKSLAIQKVESTALATAFPMRVIYTLLFPGVWLLNGVARKVLSWMGLRAAAASHEAHSEDELRIILHSSAAAGAISTPRAELLERALTMAEKTARQVLVPRNQMRYLDLEEPLEKNIADARTGGHTWLPVCRGSLDQLEGVVNVKDLFFLLSKGELKSLAQVQRTVLFVPENVTLEQLLSEFRRRRRQMAVVVDEHGGTSGMITLADVVAELVGDVAEPGRTEDLVKVLPGGKLELPGSTPLDDLEDRLDVEFDVEDGEVTTIGGYLMAKLGRVPERGDKTAIAEYEVSVDLMDGPRVVKVRIEPKVQPGSSTALKGDPPKTDA